MVYMSLLIIDDNFLMAVIRADFPLRIKADNPLPIKIRVISQKS
jgi:hypothetical protein